MSAYLRHFELTEAPFSKEIADGDLWMPPSKEELVAELEEAMSERASVMLVGEPGVGKTSVLRALRARLSTSNFRLTYCHNATLGKRDFYRQLCIALGLRPVASAGGLFSAVSSHVEELARERQTPVFLLDEAHLMQQDLLNNLHILLNYEWDSKALLSLVMVGLPELQDRLRLRHNRSLYTRIHYRLHVGSTTVEDTEAYLLYRLKRADCERPVFADDAVAMLHESAGACLRELDRLATASLKSASRRKKKLVDRSVVASIAAVPDDD